MKDIFKFGCWAALLCAVHNASALTITAVTSDNGYPAHQVQWKDSSGSTRTAIMVDQNSTSAPYTGYLRRYSYQVNGTTRVCTGAENYATGGNLEFSGDGFVQNHTPVSDTYPSGGDFSSGNGGGVPGTTTITLQGASHAIITYSMPAYQIIDQYNNARTVPTTVQWFFADGRDHPIFAISQDATATPGNVGGDSRSPYGDMNYDGDGTGAYVGGCSYGDTYKFVTLASAPEEVTTNSGWDNTQANTIPYAMQWAEPATADAELGHVATVPISLNDQGEDAQDYPVDDGRGTSQIHGPLLDFQSWAYQIINEDVFDGNPTTVKKVTWGANYGRVGGWDDTTPDYTDPRYPDNMTTSLTQYNKHYDDPLGDIETGTRANGLLMAYSVFVVFGKHNSAFTNGTVAREIAQMENVTAATFSATVGTVETSGPAGVGNATNSAINYSPAGYNPTYATWEIAAVSNAANATLTPAASQPLDHPVFVINNYVASQLPSSIAVGAGLTNAGVDYFASVDTANKRLWITVNRSVSNALNLIVEAPVYALPMIISIPASGQIGATIEISGENLNDTTAVAFNGQNATNFTVNSATNISVVVPNGATTGTITVTTPGGTAISSTTFTVEVVNYTLTLAVFPTTAGAVSGDGTFPAGSTQTAIATPNAGYQFVSWTLDGSFVSTSTNYAFTLNSNETLLANFSSSGTGITWTVLTNAPDLGAVTPNLNGKTLVTNKNYTLKAIPTSGNLFSNWTGSITTTKNPLTLKAESNLVLQANFVPNPYLSIKGTYNGLFHMDSGVDENTAGMLKNLAVAKTGTYSGSLLLGGASHAITGSFDLGLQATNNIKRSQGNVTLQMNFTNAGTSASQVVGAVFGSGWSSSLIAYRATNTVRAAEYTLLIPPDATNSPPTNSPGGDGYALITNKSGTAIITGSLADGTTISQSVGVSEDGYVPLFASLYGNKGLILGWLNLDLTNLGSARLTWIHPPLTTGLLSYRPGFTNVLGSNELTLSQWINPESYGPLTLQTRDTIDDNTATFSTNISITAQGEVSGNEISGTVASKTGLLTVTIGKGATRVTGHGAMLDATNGAGYFLTKTNAQTILIGP